MAYLLDKPTAREVFILGAGFSRAISNRMPLMGGDLTSAIGKEFSSDPLFRKVPFSNTDIELAMTYLAGQNPWLDEADGFANRALLSRIIQTVWDHIHYKIPEVLSELPECRCWLVQLVHWLHTRAAVVITFNYDTLLERAFRTVMLSDKRNQPERVHPIDLYTIPLIQLGSGMDLYGGPWLKHTAEVLKLHGSVNWFYSGRSSYSGEPLYYICPMGWSSLDPTERDARAVVAGRRPLIAPPVSDKSGYFDHEHLRFLWNRAATAIRNARRIYCIGYSLPKTDLAARFLFGAAQPPSKVPFVLVNRPRMQTLEGDVAVETHYRTVLPDTYEVDATYLAEGEPVRSFVRALLQEQPIADTAAGQHMDAALAAAIEQMLPPGTQIANGATVEPFTVGAYSTTGVQIVLARGELPFTISWNLLTQVFGAIEKSPNQRLPLFDSDPSVEFLTQPMMKFAITRIVCELLVRSGRATRLSDNLIAARQ